MFAKEDAQFLHDIETQIGKPVTIWDLTLPKNEREKFDFHDGYVITAKNYVVDMFFDYIRNFSVPVSVKNLKHFPDDEFIQGYYSRIFYPFNYDPYMNQS